MYIEDDNIFFSRSEGVVIPITEKDTLGNLVNFTGKLRYFNIPSAGLRIQLTPDVGNAYQTTLSLTISQLGQVTRAMDFALTDEDSTIPVAIWNGFITALSNL